VWVAFCSRRWFALNPDWGARIAHQVLDAYEFSPARPMHYSWQGTGQLFFVSLLEGLMTPLFIIFLQSAGAGPGLQLIPIALLGTWALVVNGTFFGRSRCAHPQPE